jgi:heme/copper-type cytochrome/quinol oxidase subunit 2
MARRQWSVFATLSAAVVCLVGVAAQPGIVKAASGGADGQDQGGTREFTVVGSHNAFRPANLEVHRNDLVKITFTAEDIAHSFTVDGYRISKRAGVGQSVTFEFRADQAGSFPYYCNLSQDDGCRNMKGTLTVR